MYRYTCTHLFKCFIYRPDRETQRFLVTHLLETSTSGTLFVQSNTLLHSGFVEWQPVIVQHAALRNEEEMQILISGTLS
jgi:hypothetical protein